MQSASCCWPRACGCFCVATRRPDAGLAPLLQPMRCSWREEPRGCSFRRGTGHADRRRDMNPRRARILVVDNSGSLSLALEPAFTRHEVDIARDAFDAIYRIDCAARPYDVLLCDLARGDVPGPELWAYLSIGRKDAAERMVFVASAPLGPEARAFLARVPNPCLELPVDPEAFDALTRRRTVARRSAWAAKLAKTQLHPQATGTSRE